MVSLGTSILGSSQLGVITKTINLSATSSSTLSQSINAIFALKLQPADSRLGDSTVGDNTIGQTSGGVGAYSNFTHSVNGTFTLSKVSSSTTTLNNNLNGVFTLSIKSTRNRIAESALGSSQLGTQSSKKFDSYSQFKPNASAIFSLSKVSQSDSSFSGNIIRARVINVSSTSVATFEFILSEDSYAEQYGRERGNAEIDTVVEGDAELDIIVVGNAQVD